MLALSTVSDPGIDPGLLLQYPVSLLGEDIKLLALLLSPFSTRSSQPFLCCDTFFFWSCVSVIARVSLCSKMIEAVLIREILGLNTMLAIELCRASLSSHVSIYVCHQTQVSQCNTAWLNNWKRWGVHGFMQMKLAKVMNLMICTLIVPNQMFLSARKCSMAAIVYIKCSGYGTSITASIELSFTER